MPSPHRLRRVHWHRVLIAVACVVAGCATPPSTAPSTPPAATPAAPAAAPIVSAGVSSPPSAAAAPTPAEPSFANWIADFMLSARSNGINAATLQAAFADVRYLPDVVERDRSQAEFTRTVWQYLDATVSPSRIALGQERLFEVRAQADAAAAQYGVPAPILVAIWGMESNYGSNYGSVPAVDALATLGFDGRRGAWAQRELLAALRILQNGDIDRAHMIGSWAGAMGQTQFLPSNFLAYAVDADGDGRRDIWGSMDDVLASTANFLARSGWRAGETWGVEVVLPDGFDVSRADPGTQQPSAAWASEGVRSADGASLPDLTESSIWLPAGARGPAFLLGPNFRTILRYNNATSYALAVGLLAQQLAGGPGIQAPWPRELQTLSRSQLQAVQAALNSRGFDSGAPDGLAGPRTRSAIRAYQQSAGLPADGYPTTDLLERLQSP